MFAINVEVNVGIVGCNCRSDLWTWSDVDRLYIPRRDEGRGLIAIEDYVELAVRVLEVSVYGSGS